MLFELYSIESELLIIKEIIMKNNSAHINTRGARKINLSPATLNMRVHVDDIRPSKDIHEHEKVRRQRQDLYDSWEQMPKKHYFINQKHIG